MKNYTTKEHTKEEILRRISLYPRKLRKTIIKYFPEIWCKLEYQFEETRMNFRVYQIIGAYLKVGSKKKQERTELKEEDFDINKRHFIDGYVKFDGCMEFKQDSHYCYEDRIEQTHKILKIVYKLAEDKFDFW